jgi:hypothetical protein
MDQLMDQEIMVHQLIHQYSENLSLVITWSITMLTINSWAITTGD